MASRERGRPARTMMAPGSAGVPPAPSLAQPRPSPPLGSTGNGAMALLRPGRCCSRRQGGCLQHRTEAQRRPKEQVCGRDARAPRAITPPLRGSRRSRAARRRLMPWGVSGGRLLRKPTCTPWETPVCPPAVPLPPDRADRSRVKQRIIVAYPEQGLFREKPVGDKTSCLSCPSMQIRDLLMPDAETKRREHHFVTLV